MNLPVGDLPLVIGGSLLLLWWSRKPLRHPGSHGFYRFFAWECILLLIVLNRELTGDQRLSVFLLQASLGYVLAGFVSLRFYGHSGQREDGALFGWEKTTTLVTQGIFRYIRHPMYAALLGLTWGMCFRALSWPAIALAVASSFFMLCTVRIEEKECIAYFGQAYIDYMQRTRRFLPWLY